MLKEVLDSVAKTKLDLEIAADPTSFGQIMREGTEFEFFRANEAKIAQRRDEIFKELLGPYATFDEMSAAITDFLEKGEDVEDANLLIAESIINTSQAFTKDFTDALLEGQDGLEAFKDFSQNIVSQIIQIFLQMEVVNRILANIFPNVGGINYGGIVTPAGSTDASAGGGRVGMGLPTLVGERGPELFIPQSHGTVLNNMNTKSALGGGQPVIVNQSLNFSTGVVPTVRAEVTKMLPQIADVTKGAVLESAMRGGSYRRGLTGG